MDESAKCEMRTAKNVHQRVVDWALMQKQVWANGFPRAPDWVAGSVWNDGGGGGLGWGHGVGRIRCRASAVYSQYGVTSRRRQWSGSGCRRMTDNGAESGLQQRFGASLGRDGIRCQV